MESGEREEVFAKQKPPPSPENMNIVILDLIQDLPELHTHPFSKFNVEKINELRNRTRNRGLTLVFTQPLQAGDEKETEGEKQESGIGKSGFCLLSLQKVH